MEEKIAKIKENSEKEIESVNDLKNLDVLRVKYLGKKGELTLILKEMGKLSKEERPVIGSLVNKVRDELNIEIYGEDRSSSGVNRIKIEKTMQYDDGNRVLLYAARRGKDISSIIDSWKGNKMTIKSAKGRTLEHDIVIVGISLNYRLYYTAITRTKKSVYTTIEKINFSSKWEICDPILWMILEKKNFWLMTFERRLLKNDSERIRENNQKWRIQYGRI